MQVTKGAVVQIKEDNQHQPRFLRKLRIVTDIHPVKDGKLVLVPQDCRRIILFCEQRYPLKLDNCKDK